MAGKRQNTKRGILGCGVVAALLAVRLVGAQVTFEIGEATAAPGQLEVSVPISINIRTGRS